MYVYAQTPCGVLNAQGTLLKLVRYLHMMLFCESRHTEGCPSVMYISVITSACVQWHRAVFGTYRAPCWSLQGIYLHMVLFCEHKYMEGCPFVMHTSVIEWWYCAVTSCGVFNAQGALLKSQRCVTLQCCSFSCWRKYQHKTNGQRKKTNSKRQTAEVRIRTNECAIKV
jgi:hypothetical protein